MSHLTVSEVVVVHPAVTCGACDGCRRGMDMHCATWRFPGVDGWPGGYAELMRMSARALVKLAPGTEPANLATFADVVLDLTNGRGAQAVLDLVGEGPVPEQALRMLAKSAAYSIVGYGGGARIEHLDMINRELTILGNQIGTHAELSELMTLAQAGKVTLATQSFALDDAAQAMAAVASGQVAGRAVLVP